MDLISRRAAIETVGKAADELYENIKRGATFPQRQWFDGMAHAQSILENLPSAEPEIIRCKDCRWWDKYGDFDIGYCMAARHSYYSEHWEINIRRTYKEDFYCADAEPKGEQE